MYFSFLITILYASLAGQVCTKVLYEWGCINVFVCTGYIVYLDKSNLNANDADVCSFSCIWE